MIPVLAINVYTQKYTNLLIDSGHNVTFICPQEYYAKNSELVARANFIVENSAVAGYPELNLGNSLLTIESDWYLRLDSDEWIPSAHLTTLDRLLPYLDKSCCYGFTRDWVCFKNGIFKLVRYKRMFWKSQFSIPGAALLHDQNYRLFHRDYIYPKRSLHSNGWFSASYNSITEAGPIYHLDWILNSKIKFKKQGRALSEFSLTDFSEFEDVYNQENSKDSEEFPLLVDSKELEYLLKEYL